MIAYWDRDVFGNEVTILFKDLLNTMGSAVEFTKEYDEYLLILQMSTSAVTVKRVLFYMKLCHLTKHRESSEENIQVQLFSPTIKLWKQRVYC